MERNSSSKGWANETLVSGLHAKTAGMPFELYTFRNGVRLVHQMIESPVAYCALMMNAGSRDELKNEYGIAHLVEHLMFKGTGKRKAHHILSRMENVGGELNAFTSKEDTCIHAAFLNSHYARSLELFSDMVFNHKVTDKVLHLEKNVVCDEIRATKDSPAELIFDQFDELLFPNHPLGRNTLGTVHSVGKLDQMDVERFVARNYHPDRMVISSVGNIPFQRLIASVEKYFGEIEPTVQATVPRVVPEKNVSFEKYINKKNHQSHCIIGVRCDGSDLNFRIAMTMLANLLGGPGMNTRLNMSLRERYGWVYHVEASYTSYSDVGVFSIYFATDKAKLENCVAEIEKELNKLKKEPLTERQLKKLQLQMMGQMAIASDHLDARMLSAGKSLLMFDKVDNLYDLCVQMNKINAEYLFDVANKVFCKLNFLTYR